MKRYALFSAVAFGLIFSAATAQAKTWAIDTNKSHIAFAGTQGNDHFTGGFHSANMTIDFDLIIRKWKITALIDTASAFAGNPDRDQALPTPDILFGQIPQGRIYLNQHSMGPQSGLSNT